MDIKVVQEIVNSTIAEEKFKLSEAIKKHIERINHPWDFYGSHPKEYKEAATENRETKIQRDLYHSNPTNPTWWDLELPIGQERNYGKRTKSVRIDLIGKIDNKLTLCELKYTKIASQPLDAILQLISYYIMLCNNAEKLDEFSVHHTNTNESFLWTSFKEEPVRLMLLANELFFKNYSLSTPKNEVAKALIKKLGDKGLVIELWTVNENEPISIKKRKELCV